MCVVSNTIFAHPDGRCPTFAQKAHCLMADRGPGAKEHGEKRGCRYMDDSPLVLRCQCAILSVNDTVLQVQKGHSILYPGKGCHWNR